MSRPTDLERGARIAQEITYVPGIGWCCSGPVDVRTVLRAARDSVPVEQLFEYCAAVAAVADLIEKAEAALHYMRLHRYADQAWADDLAAALARMNGGAA